jgi:flagellum-specific ATP synthase
VPNVNNFHKRLNSEYESLIDELSFVRRRGRITKVIGVLYESQGPQAAIGEQCVIIPRGGGRKFPAEVVGFRDNRVLLMPFVHVSGVGPGAIVETTSQSMVVPVGPELLGRVVDGFGQPIDGKGPIYREGKQPVEAPPPKPFGRRRIEKPLPVGIRSVDGLLTLGRGQKVGIFAGSGVGKSVMLGMVARNTRADINVITLIGERGREVQDFIDKDLGEEGLKRSVVVVVTNDQPALLRIRGAMVGTAIAEYFRDQNKNVMLLMDSVTRVAMAQREIGLAAGEPPTTRGYPPSMYAMLPRLLERAGIGDTGSITAIYTVLVEGDDMTEPVADVMRSILDGHIVLSRKLASGNHYPAVDVLDSVSRLMIDVVSKEHRAAADNMIDLIATYRDSEDLINIGAYQQGSNPKIDRAVAAMDTINEFLRQDMYEKSEYRHCMQEILRIGGQSMAPEAAIAASG